MRYISHHVLATLTHALEIAAVAKTSWNLHAGWSEVVSRGIAFVMLETLLCGNIWKTFILRTTLTAFGGECRHFIEHIMYDVIILVVRACICMLWSSWLFVHAWHHIVVCCVVYKFIHNIWIHVYIIYIYIYNIYYCFVDDKASWHKFPGRG